MKKITVVTPTFNRAYILSRCYKSLINQTNQSFKWLVIDDGSTDNTKELINTFTEEGLIEIKYIYKNNHGKQAAINTAIDNCDTDFYAFLDSDDLYYEDSIEKFLDLIQEIENDENVACIVARRGDEDKLFKQFNKIDFSKKVLKLTELYNKYEFHAETCVVCKTEILRTVKYPNIKDKFIPESYMFDKISQKYQVLFVNEAFSITEYLDDGYTNQDNSLYKNNPYGVQIALYEAAITNYGFVRNIKNMIWYINWCKINKLENKIFEHTNKQFMYQALKPPAYLIRKLKMPSWMW